MVGSITAAELRRRYQAGEEIAIVDAREEGVFHDRHLLMASCLPLSRLELLAPSLLPRRSVPIVVCDAGEGLAARAASRLAAGGYSDVSVLDGGVEAWETAGYPVYSGVHVPSKAFAERQGALHEPDKHRGTIRNCLVIRARPQHLRWRV